MGMRRNISLTLIVFCVSLLYPVPSKAVHKGAGNLTCGSCHTMHSSQGGANSPSMGGAAGSLILLRAGGSSISSRAEIHKLCLQCHASNGTQADVVHAPQNVKAPKVYSSGTWSQNDPFNKIGAGGNFYAEIDSSWNTITPSALGNGHSLGAPSSVTPPGGDQPIGGDGFSCTNCHDPHGTASTADANTNIFRNLKTKATGSGAYGEGTTYGVKFYYGATEYSKMKSYVGGVTGVTGNFNSGETDNNSQVIWPVYRGTLVGDPATDSANSNSYATGDDINCDPTFGCNGTVAVTMSRWCAQCHDNWHEDITNPTATPNVGNGPYDGSNFPDWKRHPVNGMMPVKASRGCATGCHLSLLDRETYTTQVITSGKALPVTASSDLSNTTFAGNELVYYLPYADLSACKDNPNPPLTCMDTPTPGSNHKVFCLSCHFAHAGPYYDALRWNYTSAVESGSQTGNSIASNVGCQLCHNR